MQPPDIKEWKPQRAYYLEITRYVSFVLIKENTAIV